MGTDRKTSITSSQIRNRTIQLSDIAPDALVWQEPVIDKDLSSPPGSPSEGDRYIVASVASGDWTGHENKITQYISSSWSFYTPLEGWFTWVKDENKLYSFDGASWAEFAGGGDTLPIVDTTGIAKGSGDATKIVRLEVDGITTETTRVLTVQDKDYTIADKAEVDKTKKTTIGLTIDGSGIELTTGYKGFIRVPYACTITKATLLGDISGDIVIDLWKCSYADYDAGVTHPVDGDSITSATSPTLSSATKSEDSTLTDWTTSITAGDIIAFNVDSITDITKVTLILEVTKT